MNRAVEIGGREGVERVVRAFIERCHADFIIGFLFEGTDAERTIRHETEMALRLLGDKVRYTGRPIGRTHAPKRINQGHYRRRQAILRTVLTEQGVPEDIAQAWLAHQESFRDVVTNGRDCVE